MTILIIFILLVAIGVYWFVLREEDSTPTPDPRPPTPHRRGRVAYADTR